MSRLIREFLMIRGVEIFTEYVPTRVLRQLFKNVEPIELLNGLVTAARITASEWKS